MSFWPDFLVIASVHLLAVASPGPDFAIVLRYAVRYGRRAAIFASFGIGLAILLHVTYSLVGIGVLISTTPWLFQLLSVLAACYLLYLAQGALRAKAPDTEQAIALEQSAAPASRKAFVAGFITNGLNPKATLFFLSLFAVVISTDTPLSYKLFYGVYLSIATAAWFVMLSMVLTNSRVRGLLLLKGYWFDRIMGGLLLLLALQLLYSIFQSL